MKTYLVGGAVRDILLGREARDRDYVVVGATVDDMLAEGFEKVGADFPVFLHPTTGEEYALARSERKTGPGYNGFDTRFTPDVTLEEDLFRRDLTINSMAMDKAGNVIDPYGGQKDLADKILRHTSEAFAEDPVRVLRIARFAARYTDFTIHEDTYALMASVVASGEFDHLTAERVWAEFKKGLMEKQPSKMYDALCGPVDAWRKLPEFFEVKIDELKALDAAAAKDEPLPVRFAIVSGGFMKPEHFQKWTIPSDCSDVASLVTSNMAVFGVYDHVSPEARVSLLTKLDIIRRPERFEQVMKAAKYIARNATPGTLDFMIGKMHHDVEAFRKVDAGKIAASVPPKDIKQAIHNARVQALKGE